MATGFWLARIVDQGLGSVLPHGGGASWSVLHIGDLKA
jgi:hypothetical protein